MSEQAPSEEVDTPTIASPEVGTPGSQQTPAEKQAEIDYQQRYDELRPEFDRKSQRLSELEQREQWFDLLATSEDPEARRQAAQNLGYEVTDDEPETGEQPYLTREEWKAYQDQQKQQQEQAAQEQLTTFLETTARSNMQTAGVPEHLHEWVLGHALAQSYATPEGHVDVQRAYKEFVDQVRAAEQAEWAKTKRTTHRVSAVGGEGTQQPDLSTREGRDAYVMSQLEEE